MARRRREEAEVRDIARQRVRWLFELADRVFERDPALADRYVELARLIAMRVRVRIPRDLRRRFCHNCGCLLKPGVNCRVRLAKRRSPHLAITCLRCGYVHRIPYKG